MTRPASALQMFYGPLEWVEPARLTGRLFSVRQTPFLKLIDGRTAVGRPPTSRWTTRPLSTCLRLRGPAAPPPAGCTSPSRLHAERADIAKVTGQRDYFARHAGLNE